MTIEILPYSVEWESPWDEFCSSAVNATFLHTRKFLNYHRERFTDASILILHEGSIVGVLPAALSESNLSTLISHPGATFGGIVHQGWLTGVRMLESIDALRCYYLSKGFEKLLYKAVPHIYMKSPAQDDLYALFRFGARRTRCDLSCAINLHARRPMSERRRRSLKKANKVVEISRDLALLKSLWAVLGENLASKFGANPLHSLNEIQDLISRFPEKIKVYCALANDCVEAGVVFFNSSQTWHAQYIASSARGYSVFALDAVFAAAISDAISEQMSFFDFGTSNEEGGLVLNEGLYKFKSEFGGGGVAHEYYELELR